MISFDAHLAQLVRRKTVTKEEAITKALHAEAFSKEMQQVSH
jgi:hypothetical protein